MKYLKKYENMFTNIFKSSDVDHWDEYVENDLEDNFKYNKLMQSADDGNLKRFIFLLPEYKDKLNDIWHNKNVLIQAMLGNGDNYEKRNMIKLLLDNGIDYNFKFEDKTFYDLMNNKLKMWFDKNYPDIVKELELNKNIKKYNL